MATPFSIRTEQPPVPHLRVLHLAGDLGSLGTDTLRSAVDAAVRPPQPHAVVLDLTDLTFVNSRGVGAIVALHAHLQHARVVLVLAAAQGVVREVLDVVGISHIIPCVSSVAEAVETQGDPAA